MKYFLLLFLSACSTIPSSPPVVIANDRLPASTNSSECSTLDNIVGAPISDQAICLYAKNYFHILTSGRTKVEVIDPVIPNENLTLALKIIIKKKDLEEVLGRGGMRIRYMRYLLNELSIARANRDAIKTESKNALEKFKPVELILDIKED